MRDFINIHRMRRHLREDRSHTFVNYLCSVGCAQATKVNRAAQNRVARYRVCRVPSKFAATIRQFVRINSVFAQGIHCGVRLLLFLKSRNALKGGPCARWPPGDPRGTRIGQRRTMPVTIADESARISTPRHDKIMSSQERAPTPRTGKPEGRRLRATGRMGNTAQMSRMSKSRAIRGSGGGG
jgi:hypothetical protein